MSLSDQTLPGMMPDGRMNRVTAPRSVLPARGRGALLGLAVGDALGTTLEFSTRSAPELPTLVTGPHTEVVGGGPFGLAPGQVTDDTHMATCLAQSLMASGGLNPSELVQRYIAWSAVTFDIGNQTSSALRRAARGGDPRAAGHKVWLDSGRAMAGNGSLMRTLPIGVFFHGDDEWMRDASLDDSSITHADPRCLLACVAYNAAVARAIGRSTTPVPAQELWEAAQAALSDGATALLERHPEERSPIEEALEALQSDLYHATQSNPDLYGLEVHLQRMAGFVRVAFRLAFWHLLHTDSYPAALIDTVNRGGDADTNGAIVGGLLGARLGEEAIPAAWRERVLGALQTPHPTGPFATLYHPRALLELVRV